MTRWATPLALTRGLLVGLCLCWPSYTTPEGTERGPSQDQTQTQDDVEAVRLAADQGDAGAQYDLGLMYAEGRGVPQDNAEAARWFRLAADQGHAEAQYDLGIAYVNGRGVPQDEDEAARWFRLAADQGDVRAQTSLGSMYANGCGVSQDRVTALMWLSVAAAQISEDRRTATPSSRNEMQSRQRCPPSKSPRRNASPANGSRPWNGKGWSPLVRTRPANGSLSLAGRAWRAIQLSKSQSPEAVPPRSDPPATPAVSRVSGAGPHPVP